MNSKIASKLAVVAMASLMACGASVAQDKQAVACGIKKQEGAAEIIRDGKSIPAELGATVLPGDTIKTAKGASVGLMLKDETRIAVGSSSQVALEKFQFNANTNNGNMFVSIVKGTFAMISGLLVKNNPTAATIKTPTSTAGVRGTYFVVEVP